MRFHTALARLVANVYMSVNNEFGDDDVCAAGHH
jgi:hypothetical protein